MALINKIRERSGLAVGVLAVALIAFIVGGDLMAGQGGGLFGNDNKVGEISGTGVDYRQFMEQVDVARVNYESQTGRSANPQEIQQLRDQVWEEMIFNTAFKDEFDNLGLTVTPEELKEMVQGTTNLHPYVRQQFTDQQTGLYDRQRHMEFISAVANNQLPEAQKVAWDDFKKQLVQFRVREKYEKLLTSSTYITKAEAKREYVAQTTKANANYLYVPFYSINDSTVKVTDGELSSYLNSHKDEFTGYNSRTFDYVVFQIESSKEDSISMMSDLREYAKGLAKAPNPQVYASANSDIRYNNLRGTSDLPSEVVTALDNGIEGQIVGPFKEGQAYSIYKYMGRKMDKDSVRASHILVADKALADNLLAQVKAGGNFAALATANSTDTGSKEKGGDLGYFGRGAMVAPFDAAAFSNDGLVPELVQSQFGYHIIKVTGSKSANKYDLAAISRVLSPSEATRNEVYQNAEAIRTKLKKASNLAKVAEEAGLVAFTAEKINPTAQSFNTIQDGREIVLWTYNDNTSVDEVSDRLFEINDSFIVAALKSKTDKDNPNVEDFREELATAVRNEKKAEIIKAKLKDSKSDFNTIAKSYGAGALVESVADISIATGMLNSAGIDPVAIGKIFGLPTGKRSKVFAGENGVFMVEVTSRTNAPEIADYTQYKEQLGQRFGAYNSSALANQLIREKANIVDNRYKFY
jgi:peptidyl-prolyl cis-trans isomerase D